MCVCARARARVHSFVRVRVCACSFVRACVENVFLILVTQDLSLKTLLYILEHS